MSQSNSPLKATLRAAHRLRRKDCDPMDPGFERRILDLEAWHSAKAIAGYLGYGSEPRATHLLQSAAREGRQVFLPILQPDGDLTWSEWSGDLNELVRRRNLLEPRGSSSFDLIETAEIVITPALAVDRRGYRLGQGGGSFDRALKRAPSALSVALIYDHEVLDELPIEEHDLRVSVAITPSQTLWFV